MDTTVNARKNSTATESPSPTDYTQFQIEILTAVVNLTADDELPYGLAIKDQLEDVYGETINHGRLYPNLDELVQDGLLEKAQEDLRTNRYDLTTAGHDLLVRRADRIDQALANFAGGGHV